MPFLFFLNFLWHLWRFRVHNSCSSRLVISMGNFLRVVSEIVPAMFFLINIIGVIFEAGNETREKIWNDFCAKQKRRAERKEWFWFIPLFLREREIDV